MTVPRAKARTVLHLAPHPDDELIGAGATLLGLKRAAWRVVSFACGLGRPEHRDRRRREFVAASERAGFDRDIQEPPVGLSRGDDLARAQEVLTDATVKCIRRYEATLVVAPSPHDAHHGHEVVGRAVRDALESLGDEAPVWWMWGIWADLPLPTLLFPFSDDLLDEVLNALRAYRGELERNDYARLVCARAAANSVLGPERVFKFGARGLAEPYAELLTEVVFRGGEWQMCKPRKLDARDPMPGAQPDALIDWWLYEPSEGSRLRAVRAP